MPKCDAVYPDYTGRKTFHVSHPSFRNDVRVRAPNKQAAVVAAAMAWNTRWTAYEFYAYCKVY